MSNEEILHTVIEVMDGYNYFDSGFVIGELISDILSIFGKEDSNDIVVGVLSELEYIEDQSTQDDFFKTGIRLEDLRDSLSNGDVPKIITEKNLVFRKAISTMQNATKRAELNNLIRDTLKKDGEHERVETFKRRLVCLCKEFNVNLIPEDREGCIILHEGFSSEIMSHLLEDMYYER